MEDFTNVLAILDAGGSVALLLLVVVLGLRGDVVPRSVISAIVSETVEEVLKRMERKQEGPPNTRN